MSMMMVLVSHISQIPEGLKEGIQMAAIHKVDFCYRPRNTELGEFRAFTVFGNQAGSLFGRRYGLLAQGCSL